MHQHRQWLAVLHQVAQALQRVVRVQGHIGTAGLEDAQQADQQFRAALHAEPDSHIRPHPLLAQVMGQLVGALVELPVAQLPRAGLQCNGLGRAPHLGLEQGMQGQLPRVLRTGGIERLQQVARLHRRQDRQAVQRRLRRLFQGQHQRFESGAQVAQQALRADPPRGPAAQAEPRFQVVHRQHQRVAEHLSLLSNSTPGKPCNRSPPRLWR